MDEPWDDIDRLAEQGILTLGWPYASILDLGCGGGLNHTLSFYAKHPFARYVGVDIDPEDRIVTFESVTAWQRFMDKGAVSLPELDRVQFNRLFEQVYACDVLNHLESDQSQYDLVILSSLLHLSGTKERWKSILTHALRVAKLEGYVYITVFDKETGYGHFDDSGISEMCSMMDVVCHDSGVGSRRQLRILGRPFADRIN